MRKRKQSRVNLRANAKREKVMLKKHFPRGLKIANGYEKSPWISIFLSYSFFFCLGSHSVTHVPWFPAQLFSGKTSLIFTIARSKF